MATTKQSPFPFPPKRLYRAPDIPMRVIRRYARAIAEEFRPDQIILFGSYAHGTPHEDSDVDLLVVMPARNAIDLEEVPEEVRNDLEVHLVSRIDQILALVLSDPEPEPDDERADSLLENEASV